MAAPEMSSNPHETVHDDHDHGGIGKYIVVFVALCILTLCSFLTYFDFWDQRVPDNISRIFMMAVSCTKAMLVILFFMHLLWEANWKYVLTVPAAMMSIFLVLMLVPDVGRRVNNYSNERWTHAAEPHVTSEHAAEGSAHGDSHAHAADGHSGH